VADQIFQTSYSQRPSEALPGQLAEAFSPGRRTAKVARGRIKAGYGLFMVQGAGANGTNMLDAGEAFHISDPGTGADVDAIKASAASSASILTLDTAAELDGVVGLSEMQPPRKVTLITSSHADWDAGTAVVTGYNDVGQLVSENLSMANAGAETLTTTNYFRQVTKVVIPAQSGTGGTFTIGIAALAALVLIDFLGIAIRKPIKTTVASAGLYGYPGLTSSLVTCDYVDAETISVMTSGGIYVYTEEAVVERDPVYVRVAAGAGGSTLGAFRNDADTASAVLLPDARFTRSAAAGCARLWLPHAG
jgi:hypothetical protein